jgi:hypothetical protein
MRRDDICLYVSPSSRPWRRPPLPDKVKLAVLAKTASQTQPRHRAKEFIRILKEIDRCVQKYLDLHRIVDNYGTHKTSAVKAWLATHPRRKPQRSSSKRSDAP